MICYNLGMQEEKLPSSLSPSVEEYEDLSKDYPLLQAKTKKMEPDSIIIFSDKPIDLTDENVLKELIKLIQNNPNIKHILIENKIVLDNKARTDLEKCYRNPQITCQLRYQFDYAPIPGTTFFKPDETYDFQRFLRGLAARNQRAINKENLTGELKAQPLPLVKLPKKSKDAMAKNVRRVKLLDQNAIKKLGGKQIQQQQEEQQEQVQQQQRAQHKQTTRQQLKAREELFDKLQDRLQRTTHEKADKNELGVLFTRSMLLNQPEKFTDFRPNLPRRPDTVHGIT